MRQSKNLKIFLKQFYDASQKSFLIAENAVVAVNYIKVHTVCAPVKKEEISHEFI